MISLLAADTSTPFLSLSLLVAQNHEAVGWQLAEQIVTPIPTGRDDWLHKAVSSVLARHSLPPISALALGHGPGSFTGLRISFSYFRAIAAIEEIPLLSFSSLAYWRSCFPVDSGQPFLVRMSRTMYYGLDSQDNFRALSLEEWYRETPSANVWCETWRDNGKFPVIEHNWPHFRFLNSQQINCVMPPLPAPAKLFSNPQGYHWQNCQPEYGHDLPFLKNPVQARKKT